MDPAERSKAAFITPFGMYRPKRMMMGLAGSPATYQALMTKVLAPFLYRFACVYLDDVIIYSKTYEEHISHLRQVFDALRAANLKASPEKCKFGFSSLVYLGHVVGKEGLRTDPAKVRPIEAMLPPSTVTQVRSFMGAVGYYGRFLPMLAHEAAPLTALLRKKTPFVWTEEHQAAFDRIKHLLTTAPILRRPQYDRPFILATDYSTEAVDAVFSQRDDDGMEYVVAYASKKLTPTQKRWM
jgi:hypothetical protein